MKYTFGLCAGRHDCPVTDYIFPTELNSVKAYELISQARKAIPADATLLEVYVTGFTPAMLAVAHVCFCRGITLVAFNYDRESGEYCRFPS